MQLRATKFQVGSGFGYTPYGLHGRSRFLDLAARSSGPPPPEGSGGGGALLLSI
jgi:hypothetical protein